MAIRKVAQMGHPVLRQIARPVSAEEIASPGFQQLCDDLLETMFAYDGLGLAAPQIHESVRVVVFQLSEEDGPMFLVNPVVTPTTEHKVASYEGCLSVHNMRGRVARPDAVRVESLDRYGQVLVFNAFGWAARVVQHECDHLDGVLYVDHVDPRSLAFLPEYRKYGPLIPPDPDEDESEEE